MKKTIILLVVLFPLQAFGVPVTYLEMHSEQGDYIGQGLDYFFNDDDGVFSASQAYYGNQEYDKNSVRLSFIAPGYSDWWYLSFSTHELGIELEEGTYDAVRFPFEPVGVAGMSISGDGRGSNRLTGTFTVFDINFGTGSSIDSFYATFEQHSAGRAPALYGTISYNSEASPVPEPSTIILFSVGMMGLLRRQIFQSNN